MAAANWSDLAAMKAGVQLLYLRVSSLRQTWSLGNQVIADHHHSSLSSVEKGNERSARPSHTSSHPSIQSQARPIFNRTILRLTAFRNLPLRPGESQLGETA